MATHGIARANKVRTEEQRLQDLDKIAKYRDLESQARHSIAADRPGPDTLQLTSRLLRLNPEYYTIWNDRRRLLISSSLSRPSASPSSSTSSPSSGPPTTSTLSGAAWSSTSSAATQHGPAGPTTGRSGTTADEAAVSNATSVDANADEAGAARDQELLRSELTFTVPLLMEFPKCYWIWNYRLWVLEQAIERLAVATARRIWEEELGLVSKMLTKDRRNFHAWGYRRHVVARLESPVLQGKSMVEDEFAYTTRMVNVDLSNFSAWHNRAKLIPRLLEERGADAVARKALFDSEIVLIRDALDVGPEDQSLWYYHQYLLLDLDGSGKDGSVVTTHFSSEERVSYVRRRIDEIKDLLQDYNDIKWIYHALMEATTSLARLEQRDATSEEKTEIKLWLAKVRALDPMRSNRWHDMQTTFVSRWGAPTVT